MIKPVSVCYKNHANTTFWFPIQEFYPSSLFGLETPKNELMSNENLNRTDLWEPVGDFMFSQPRKHRDPVQPHSVPVEMSFNVFWHRRTKRDLGFGSQKCCQNSQTIRANANIFSFMDTGQYSLYLSLKAISFFPRKMLTLLSTDCPQTPVPLPSTVPGTSVNQASSLTGGVVS